MQNINKKRNKQTKQGSKKETKVEEINKERI
jgi:hypothetical protein